jgi:hypothetical protein
MAPAEVEPGEPPFERLGDRAVSLAEGGDAPAPRRITLVIEEAERSVAPAR